VKEKGEAEVTTPGRKGKAEEGKFLYTGRRRHTAARGGEGTKVANGKKEKREKSIKLAARRKGGTIASFFLDLNSVLKGRPKEKVRGAFVTIRRREAQGVVTEREIPLLMREKKGGGRFFNCIRG